MTANIHLKKYLHCKSELSKYDYGRELRLKCSCHNCQWFSAELGKMPSYIHLGTGHWAGKLG